MIQEGNRTKVEKAGLEDQIRDGFEYEMTISFNIVNDKHMASVSKDRTGLFSGKSEFVITSETGSLISDWCNEGFNVASDIADAVGKLPMCDTIEDLKLLKAGLPQHVILSQEFIAAGQIRYNEINTK